jgi:hypothetical protein
VVKDIDYFAPVPAESTLTFGEALGAPTTE